MNKQTDESEQVTVSKDEEQLTHKWETGTINKTTILYSCLQVYAVFYSRDIFTELLRVRQVFRLQLECSFSKQPVPLCCHCIKYLQNKMCHGDLCWHDAR